MADEDIPRAFVSTVMLREIGCAGRFGRFVKPPVEAVDVEVNVLAAAGDPAHVPEGVLHPGVAEVAGVFRPVTQPAKRFTRFGAGVETIVSVTPGPAVHKAATAKDDLVVHVHAAAEPIMAQLRRAVIAVEHRVHRMLWRAHIVAAGVAMHLELAVRGELRAPVSVEQLQRGGPFPCHPTRSGIRIDSRRGIPEPGLVRHDAQAWEAAERVAESRTVNGMADDARI